MCPLVTSGVYYTDTVIYSTASIYHVDSNTIVLSDLTSSNYTKLSPTLDSNGTDLLQIKSVNIETGEDTQVQRLEVNSILSGINPTASAPGAATFGINNIATNTGSFVEGVGTLASGFAAHAAGFNTTASGYAAFSVGVETDADGTASFAAGSGSLASGIASFAVGFRTTASGLASLTAGTETDATAQGSVAFGSLTLASGDNSFAAGQGSIASGDNSIAMGLYTTAEADGQVTLGQYNELKSDKNNVLVIGAGINEASRHNIIEVIGGNKDGEDQSERQILFDVTIADGALKNSSFFAVSGSSIFKNSEGNAIDAIGTSTFSGGTTQIETLSVTGNTSLTGKLTAIGGITGSLFGTSSWAINALTASFVNTASTNAFVQGGNSFGATALLGTNDNQNLQLETNNTVRVFISSSGNVGIGTNLPSAELHISGASIDSLLRVGSPTQANTLFVTGSNRVGIGTGTPSALFEVNGKIIAEAAGNVGIQTVPTDWIHLSSDPANSKYLNIDATQTSNPPAEYTPSSGSNTVNKVVGSISDSNVLGTPDYWMEIKLDGNLVLIPCYTPTP